MTLAATFKIGSFTCHALEGGRLRLDGGAMFGIVPKALWERRIAPDDRNRIRLAMRCLLIEHDAGPVVVDTGLGNKENEKFRNIYGVDNSGQRGPTQLDDALAEVGYAAHDIRYVINTHLHFDHAGGNTCLERGGGEVGLAFPNATYVVQKGELDVALHPNERTAGSYLPGSFTPVVQAERWQLAEGPFEVLPGIQLLPTPGHGPYHQSVLVSSGGDTACFLGDLVPTTAHLTLPWIMGYDVEPLVTLETKRTLLAQAETEGWVLVFEHDPERGLGRVERDGKSYAYKSLDTP